MNVYDNLKDLCNKINFKYINFDIINKNIDYLVKISDKIKKIWKKIKINQNFNNILNDSDEYKYILKNISMSNKNIQTFITNSNLKKISYLNIDFYYFYRDEEQFENDKKDILNMLKIAYCLNKFKYKKDDKKRIIIWIPVYNKRNYLKNNISEEGLKECEDNFEAFTASGVTFGTDPRITIITRHEEIEKLLIHELIHNYDLDGSSKYNNIIEIINNYKKIKNKDVSNIQNYDYNYSIYESYTELLSTYFMLIFKNIEIENINLLREKILSQIIIEILYSYNTIANLIKLNEYKDWEEFIKNQSFKGNICIYEYYYIKGLMYNNYILELVNDNNIHEIYNNIIQIIINQSTNNDLLLKNIFNYYFKQNNFKYMINM